MKRERARKIERNRTETELEERKQRGKKKERIRRKILKEIYKKRRQTGERSKKEGTGTG